MDKNLDKAYWNRRYQDQNTSWDAGDITTPLKTYFDQLKDNTFSILIPGAGNAYEAEYLFNNGFHNVYVCDLAEAPLKNFLKRCPGFDPGHLLHLNFFDLKSLSFDLVVEQTFFCALDPALRQNYFVKMADVLKPKGHLVGVLFNDVLNTDKPPFGGNKEEYLGYINPPFRIKTLETCYNSIQPRAGRELFMNLEKI